MWLIVSNIPLILNCNSDAIILYCYTIYIASVTTLIVNSVDFATLLPICSLGRSLYFFAVFERHLYIIVSMTLSIMLSKAIGVYISEVCFVFCDLSDLARIMISTLYRRFGKYSYMKLVFVILAMIIVRGLSYIFRNPIDR